MTTALVTGAARRVGAAIARALAVDGAMVIIHCNASSADAEALAAEIVAAGGRAAVVQADLSRREDAEALIPRCVAAFGTLDVLVNNASHFANDVAGNVTWQSLEAHFAPNLFAPVILSRAFAEQVSAGSVIVNVLDQKVLNLNPDFLSYTLTKVALSGLTEMLAMALAPRIRVCGVSPGLTLISGKQTPESFSRAWHAPPLGRSSTPEEIAAAVRFILATPSMTGRTIVLDGGESLVGRPRDVAFDPGLAAART